jgi:hypothetical protein
MKIIEPRTCRGLVVVVKDGDGKIKGETESSSLGCHLMRWKDQFAFKGGTKRESIGTGPGDDPPNPGTKKSLCQ